MGGEPLQHPLRGFPQSLLMSRMTPDPKWLEIFKLTSDTRLGLFIACLLFLLLRHWGLLPPIAGLDEPSGFPWPLALRLPVPRRTLASGVRRDGDIAPLAETTLERSLASPFAHPRSHPRPTCADCWTRGNARLSEISFAKTFAGTIESGE